MGISTDANGWTIITPSGSWQNGFNTGAPSSSTTMAIFISSSTGKDSGDPGFNASIQGSSAQPYRTINAGLARMRGGSPDWCLLANGDTWTDEQFDGVFLSGLAADERLVFASYDKSLTFSAGSPPIPNPGSGGARPLIKSAMGLINGLVALDRYTAVLGLELYAYTRDPNTSDYRTQLWSMTVSGGNNYAVNDTINLTAAGGTVIAQPVITVTGIGAGGALTSVNTRTPNPGIFSTTTPPTGFTQSGTSGSGSGATFSLPIVVAFGDNIAGLSTFGGSAGDVLFEDNKITYYPTGLELNATNAPATGQEARRNIVAHSYNATGTVSVNVHTPGFNGESGVTFYQNFCDMGGWDPIVQPIAGQTLNHNWYLSANNTKNPSDLNYFIVNLQLIENINTNDAYSSQVRCGGYVYNNLWFPGQDSLGPYGPTDANANNQIFANVFFGHAGPRTTSCSQMWARFGGGGNPDADNGFWNITTALASYNIVTMGVGTSNEFFDINNSDPGTMSGLLTLTNNILWKYSPTLVTANGNTFATSGFNVIDNTGVNSGSSPEPFPDPNRSVGSYVATLPGSTPNATFTASITAGVLNITSITGIVDKFDAITWSGQTKADYIESFGTGAGGTGTYNLASKTGLAPANAGSQSMGSYTTQQFITLCYGQRKETWRTDLTAGAVNNYIRAGFGLNLPGSGVTFDPIRSMGNRYGVYKTRPTKIPHAA